MNHRKLSIFEASAFCDHVLRLDWQDRHSRFAGTLSDTAVMEYCQRFDWRYSIALGFFQRGVLRGSLELRCPPKLFPERAEIALSVERPYQHQGIGSSLMRRALTIARNRGITVIDLVCLPDNHQMVGLARKFAAKLVMNYGEINATLSLARPNAITMMQESLEDGNSLFTWFIDGLRPAGIGQPSRSALGYLQS